MFVDPLAEETMTPYQYVSNNPIMRIDPTGMNHDIIDFNIDTGDIKITEKKGDDIVRFVDDDGKKVHEYKYGENGSFRQDFDLSKGEIYSENKKEMIDFTLLTCVGNKNNVDKLFSKIVDFSNVEFELISMKYKKGTANLIATTGDKRSVGYFANTAKYWKQAGFWLISHSHNHPSGSTNPSGHNDDGFPDRNTGDAGFAKSMRKLFGNKVNFYMYPKKGTSIFQYDGENQKTRHQR